MQISFDFGKNSVVHRYLRSKYHTSTIIDNLFVINFSFAVYSCRISELIFIETFKLDHLSFITFITLHFCILLTYTYIFTKHVGNQAYIELCLKI